VVDVEDTPGSLNSLRTQDCGVLQHGLLMVAGVAARRCQAIDRQVASRPGFQELPPSELLEPGNEKEQVHPGFMNAHFGIWRALGRAL
jgi:hypothetical protein